MSWFLHICDHPGIEYFNSVCQKDMSVSECNAWGQNEVQLNCGRHYRWQLLAQLINSCEAAQSLTFQADKYPRRRSTKAAVRRGLRRLPSHHPLASLGQLIGVQRITGQAQASSRVHLCEVILANVKKEGKMNDPSFALGVERKRAVTHLEGFCYKRVKTDPVGSGADQHWAQVELLLVFTTLQCRKRSESCLFVCFFTAVRWSI